MLNCKEGGPITVVNGPHNFHWILKSMNPNQIEDGKSNLKTIRQAFLS